MNPDVREILSRLVQPFPSRFVKSPPAGKFGDYVPHDIVNQRALAIVGPHSWEIVQVIRGQTDLVITNRGKPNEKRHEPRDAVVGVLGRLTVTIGDQQWVIQEPGDVEGAAAQSDGQNLKEAASDAYKRCWMRLGLGLHLWSQKDYELPEMLEHYQPVTEEVKGQERLAV